MKRGSIFELNGIPKFQEALPLALQHVVAMIVGCVTPAIIVAGAVGGNSLSAKDRVILIQASLVVSALSTLIQLFPIGKKNGFTLGSGLPMIMGVSFAYVPSMQAIAEGYGISSILGAQIIGGIVAFVMGILVKKIRVFFPPLITGTVVFTIGLSLYPTAINYMAGGTSNPDYGSWQNWVVAFLTLAVVTALNHFGKGILKLASIPDHLQCHIIHSRNRCSGSNDRNTADQTDNIQDTKICHLIHKCKKLIVHTEKTSHMHSSFVSFFFSGLCLSLLYSITKFLKKSNQNQTAVLSLLYGRIS